DHERHRVLLGCKGCETHSAAGTADVCDGRVIGKSFRREHLGDGASGLVPPATRICRGDDVDACKARTVLFGSGCFASAIIRGSSAPGEYQGSGRGERKHSCTTATYRSRCTHVYSSLSGHQSVTDQ